MTSKTGEHSAEDRRVDSRRMEVGVGKVGAVKMGVWTIAAWMVAGCLVASVGAILLNDGAAAEIVLGMVGPLLVASGSWVLAARTWLRQPERLTAVMTAAFAGKVAFFALYVVVMLRVLSLRPVPFVASFTGFFIALHMVEALALKRLFAMGAPQPLR